ncbi:unnamed protein product, partial [Brassica rapa]
FSLLYLLSLPTLRFQTNRLCSPSSERQCVRARAAAGGALEDASGACRCQWSSLFPFLIFSFCSPSSLPLPFRYVRSSRSGLAFPVEAPVARSLHLVEVAPSPDLRRGLGERGFVSRLVRWCSAAPNLWLCACVGYSGSYLGSLRVGEIPCLVLFLVCLPLVLSRVVVYGYKGFPSCPKTPSSSLSRLLVQFIPCVGDGLLSRYSLALHCGITLRWLSGLFVSWLRNCSLVLKECGCGDGSRESLVVSESTSSPSSHPGSVVLVLSQSAVVLRTFLRGDVVQTSCGVTSFRLWWHCIALVSF